MRKYRIITLFPEFFESPIQTGLMGKALEKGLFSIDLIQLRDYAEDAYGHCDDYPYGGGSGMVLMPGPLSRAVEDHAKGATVIYPSPGGKLLTQGMVKELAALEDICIICGHYEGVDQRVIDRYVDIELSIGDYVVSGGEYAALVIIDAIGRQVPGFMSNPQSIVEESFEDHLLEYPQYTRPREFDGMEVPDVLLSGNHEKIRQWRLEKSIEKTRQVRPDIYSTYRKRTGRGEKK